jgi:hypothetical protein
LDNGFCQYGQLFDPSTGRCRDIYCQEVNYKFNGTICIPDENKNSTHAYKRMSDIDISLTLIISSSDHYPRANFSKRLNSQMNKTCTNDWDQMFHDTLHGELRYLITREIETFFLGYLGIDYERITKIDYSLKEDEDDFEERSMSSAEHNDTDRIIHHDRPSDSFMSNLLSNNESAMLNFYFSITDRNETSADTLTGLHVVTLLLLASEFNVVLDLCQNYSIKVETLSIISDKNKTRDEFCSEPDEMYPTKNGIIRRRIRPDGEIDYVVDIPELETTYESGDYTYLFIVSTITQQKPPTQPMVLSYRFHVQLYIFSFI